MEIDLQAAASWAGGKAANDDGGVKITAVATDTRTLPAGALFVCLKGANFDGHKFVENAFLRGAVAAMVSDPAALGAHPGIVVPDTLAALGNLAHQYRWQHNLIPWAAVTGSNGKTTTRSLIAHILRAKGKVCEPQANFNNLVGMPLTILGNGDDTRFGVVEMGTNHPGEIHRLAEIATPTVAVVTGLASAHLEGLGSLEGVAREKAEIFFRLPPDGLAVYPAQAPYVHLLRARVPNGVRHATFSLEGPADLVPSDVNMGPDGSHFRADGQEFFLPLLGRHNVSNCLAALLAVRHFGVSFAEAAEALPSFKAVGERLQVISFSNFTVIDDAYNANPESMRAAAQALLDYPAGRRVMVVGDMAELGPRSAELHAEIGKWLSRTGIDVILAVGKEALAVAENAHGQNARQIIRYFPSVLSLLGHLKTTIEQGDVILIKGSHSMNLDRVVSAIKLLGKK
ncbi:MAG: UDP-N-acetylmuramoyl-tripeptide--D-alanyl-D-alanine ligase [Planctomycetes bacterium]|nr:UDP-N-acetylmuramoyl-tripeptide--D-alanyl-D-alanine ligase [Planctomycetota bacterium]